MSQIPALQLLLNQGWEYPSSEETIAARVGKTVIIGVCLNTNARDISGEEYLYKRTKLACFPEVAGLNPGVSSSAERRTTESTLSGMS